MQTFIERKLALEFWQSMSTLNELIGYVVLTDCREIWPEDSRDMTNKKVSGNFDFQNIFPVATVYATRLKYFLLLKL